MHRFILNYNVCEQFQSTAGKSDSATRNQVNANGYWRKRPINTTKNTIYLFSSVKILTSITLKLANRINKLHGSNMHWTNSTHHLQPLHTGIHTACLLQSASEFQRQFERPHYRRHLPRFKHAEGRVCTQIPKLPNLHTAKEGKQIWGRSEAVISSEGVARCCGRIFFRCGGCSC